MQIYITFKTKIVLIFFFLLSIGSFAQKTDHAIQLTNFSNTIKTKQVKSGHFFKVKTFEGEKIKGKISIVLDSIFISTTNDTILIHNISWIKARKQLTKAQGYLAITAVITGTYLSFATVPAAIWFLFIESNPLIILAPVATISTAIYGIRTLGGRRYKLKRWKIETQPVIN